MSVVRRLLVRPSHMLASVGIASLARGRQAASYFLFTVMRRGPCERPSGVPTPSRPVQQRPVHPTSPLSASGSSSSGPISPISPRQLALPTETTNDAVVSTVADSVVACSSSHLSATSDLLVAPPHAAALSSPSSLAPAHDAQPHPQPLRLIDTHAFRPSIPPKQFAAVATPTASDSTALLPSRVDHPDGSSDGILVPGTGVPRHPRRLWAVRDAQLQPRPAGCPPFVDGCDDRNGDGGETAPHFPGRHLPGPGVRTATAVFRASPSVVAARVSDALRRWPAAAEYDDESGTATAVTSDRCCLTVHLWRPPPPTSHSNPITGGCSVLVECTRVRGSALTFGHLCRAILNASRGLDPGDDVRPAHAIHVLELGARWEPPSDEATALGHRNAITAAAEPSAIAAALERVGMLLRKDRWEAQAIGLESLVGLVDPVTSGIGTAVRVARTIVANPARFHHLWSLIIDGRSGCGSGGGTRRPERGGKGGDCSDASYDEDEAEHDGWLRSLAMRALANALSALEAHDWHRGTLNRHPLAAAVPELVPALLEDVASGPTRPPTVRGRASTHEAAYAVRCLRILGVESPDRAEALRALERARTVGQSTHAVLEREARRCYLQFTEQDRSC